jgi:plasmid stabilization system protein ParE
MDPDRELQVLAEADARRRRVASAAQSFTPQQGEQLVGLLARNPNLSAGLLQALVAGQVPDSQADLLAAEDDGGFLGAIGDVAGDVIGAVTDSAKWALDKTYDQAIKPAVRGLVTIADGLAKELVQRPLTAGLAAAQGEADSFRQAFDEFGDSPGLNFLQGDTDPNAEGGSLGTGFFPGGGAQAESDRERTLTIRGQRADIGQALANGIVGQFSAPGERAYDVVAGVSGFAVEVFGDPLAWATLGASKAVTGARTLSKGAAQLALKEAGVVNGARRNTVLIEQAQNFFGNEKMLQRLADADAYDIMQTWAQSPANRIDVETISRLGAAKDQAAVAEVLFDAVARGDVTRKGFYSGIGNFTKRNLVDSTSRFAGPFRYFTAEGKLSGLAPRGVVSADDLGDAAGKVDSLLRQANIDRGVRAGIFNRMAAITPGRFDELFDVVTDALDEVAVKVGGAADSSLNDVARQYRNQLNDLRQYGLDSWGDPLDVPFAKKKLVQNFDGTTEELIVPTPQITSELNSLALHLPDVTDIRRAATDNRVLRSVYGLKGWEVTADATRFITRNLFKPLAILRPAYIVRIGAEEQARLSAAGFDSIFSHPFRFIQANIRNRKDLTDLLGEDLTGIARASDVITKDAHGVLADAAASRGRIFTVARRTEGEELTEEFARGWRQELGQLSAAPEARKLTELRGNIDEFKVWAQGEGREHIERLARVNDEAADLLNFGSGFDEWADGLRRRIEGKTAGWDEDLVARIVDGDIPFGGPGRSVRNAEAAFANMLRGKARQGRAPAAVKAEFVQPGRVKHMDNAVNFLFDHITGKPTSYLARFPAFRQSMIRRSGELMDSLATDDLRLEALEAVTRGLKLTKKEAKELAAASSKARGAAGPIDSVNQLNDIVKGKSAEDVKTLLFDVTRRGAAQDAMEVVVPFLDAWKEVSRTWMRLMKENPAFFVRAQAGFRELQDQGHFYTNEFGDEVFAYPGGGFLSSFVRRMNEAGGDLLDVVPAAGGALADTVTGNTPDFGVNLEGRVEGLNLVAQGVGPGFGPVIQWAAGAMPKSPDLDTMREFMAPFGTGIDSAGEITDIGGLADTLKPAWWRKLENSWREGGVDERQWNSTVGDALKALAASGDYDPTDQERLIEDAERFGKWLLIARGFTQFAGPTGPSASVETELPDADLDHPDWNPEVDPDGRFFSVGVLASDYHRLLRTYGPDEAASRFFELYGKEPFFIAQAKTRGLRELPVDAEGNRWVRENEDIVRDFPSVAGFFAPTSDDAELDFTVYQQQIDRGDRQSLTPRQQAELAAQVRARSMFQAVKEKVAGLPPAQRDRALEITKGRLEELHPGWQAPVIGVGQGQRVSDKIDALKRAVSDPRLEGNPVVQPLRAYLALRDAVLSEANARGLKTLSSDRVADLRERLRESGLLLSQAFPEFVGAWSGALSREVDV